MSITLPTDRRIGIIGLGSMGGAMATSFVGQGWTVLGFDPSEAARTTAVAAGITLVDTVDALAGIPYIVMSLPSAKIVEGTVPALLTAPGTIAIIDTTTSEPKTSQKMSALAVESGAQFVDAPVSGGNTGAATGTLASFVGGSDDAISAAQPVLAGLTGGKWKHVGPAGAGNVVKLLNNMLVSTNLLAVAEAMDVAAAYGINLDSAVAALNTATGASTVSTKMYPEQILNGNFSSGFSLGLMSRDVALAYAVALQGGATPRVFAQTNEAWQQALVSLGPAADFTSATTTFTTATDALTPAAAATTQKDS
ncbi:NAD(P)-dependent oxidoreductase [Cryobacterium sp. N21]|uniref:NAD(P)-dependent oxidoreductase n=1 Tax=Cryobacterium sp. N21 TaxID=2048289 RepID=UPI000CE3D601|nr:NAD(P)-dependent oxidoreductase [Cryobacterium sp. N21]